MPGTCSKLKERKEEITSNMEDYLEAIYELELESGYNEVRITDISRRLEVSRPSVVGMIRHLAEHKLAAHDHYGAVRLTPRGRSVAQDTLHRHLVLRRFLEEVLGLDAAVAEENACRIEHALSPEAIERFVALEEFRERGPDRGSLRGEAFRKFLRSRKPAERGGKPGPGKPGAEKIRA